MNDNNNIENDLLDSLKGIRRAEAPAFFYTRLMARIEKERQQSPIIRFLTHPATAMSVVAMVLVLNVLTISKMSNQEGTESNIQEIATVIANEYNMSSYSVYDEISSD